MQKTTFYIPKMDCPTEEKIIRDRLSQISGIYDLEFNLIQQELSFAHAGIDVLQVQNELAKVGMESKIKPDSYTTSSLDLLQSGISLRDWLIIGLSGILAVAAECYALLIQNEKSVVIIVMSLASMIIGGRQTVMKGLKAVRYFTFNMNFLMTIAIIGAAFLGEWPEAAMVTFLFTLAEAIESYSLEKARHAIRRLIEITPDTATVKSKSDAWEILPVSKLKLDDIVWVKPGERIPIDGVVTKGNSSVNQAPITGESMPVEKQIGDTVYAGSINERGSFEFRVTAHTNQTLIAKIIKAVQQAQSERAPTQRFVDQFAKYYTPIMVIAALLMVIVPTLLFHAPYEIWLYEALVLLVIACPCALVISTPITIVSGLTAAAKHGILVKGGTYLERGHLLKAIAFDKTGTLTIGKPKVTDVVSFSNLTAHESLYIAASLEAHSEHPVAEAIIQEWNKSNPKMNLSSVNKFVSISGKGVVGEIGHRLYALGNHRFAEENNVCDSNVETQLTGLEAQGKTVIVLADKEKVLAIIAVTDVLKPTSNIAINQIHNLGLTTAMITGDNPITAHVIAKQLGIDTVHANLLPTDKSEIMSKLINEFNYVGMVGDGVNDAPALSKASIGFAMGHQGTDIALETADVVIMDDNLEKIPLFITISRSTWSNLTQNIILSIGIKAVFFVLALLGMATLWMAVFADMGASLIVVFNGLRLLRL